MGNLSQIGVYVATLSERGITTNKTYKRIVYIGKFIDIYMEIRHYRTLPRKVYDPVHINIRKAELVWFFGNSIYLL